MKHDSLNHPITPPTREIPVIKAVAAWALWQTKRFTSMEIAVALEIHEADVMRIIDAARNGQ